MFSWKGPIRTIKSNSWLCAGHPKNHILVKVNRHPYIKYKQIFSLFSSIYLYLMSKWVCLVFLYSSWSRLLFWYDCFTSKNIDHKKPWCKPTLTYKSGWVTFQIFECELNPCSKPLIFVNTCECHQNFCSLSLDYFWSVLKEAPQKELTEDI